MKSHNRSRSRRPLVHLIILASVGLLAWASMACEGPVEFTHTTTYNASLNLNTAFPSQENDVADMDLPPAPIVYPVPVDLADQNPELQEYADAGLFTETTIDQIKYTVTSNSVNVDLTEIQMSVGPMDAVALDGEGVLVLAQIDEIKAMDTPNGFAQIYPDNQGPITDRIQTLEFAVVQGTEVGANAGDPVPEGILQMQIEILMTLTADPI